MKKFLYKIIYLTFFVAGCTSTVTEQTTHTKTLFSLVSSEESGVHFINEVEDLKDFNILNYRNFYNGGGVALGDINNDGLTDIFFTSNLKSNRLYLNKGEWKFEDITEAAGVGGTKAWSTGVSFADINSDGFLDIYVCNSGEIEGDDKANELYINNGDQTFSEEAIKWGLNSTAFSTHASFFDYDLDGDLDCFLLNNSFRSPDQAAFYKQSREDIGIEGGDKLFRNDGNTFVDVTAEAGIHTSDIGFGLGVSVGDLNNDMLPDIYISNDFWERDYLYINQGNGTYTDEIEKRMAHTSLNSMGADISDINNDGIPEIMSTDMLPPDNYRLKTMTQFQPYRMGNIKFDSVYHHQVMQNCLQLNDGEGTFQEISQLAEVASSDWSWGALILDLNLDGWKDIFISNGIQKDITDFDFVDIITNKGVVEQIVDQGDGFDFRDFLPFMPSTKIANSAYLNQKNLRFKEQSLALGLSEPSFSNGAAYGDLDNDGDLDLVLNNTNMESFLYRNNTVQNDFNNFIQVSLNGPEKNPFGIGAKVIISKGGQIQELQHYLSRGFESSVAPGIVFGISKATSIDTLKIIWPDKKMQVLTNLNANQQLELNYADANMVWEKSNPAIHTLFADATKKTFASPVSHKENSYNDFMDERLAHKLLSTEGPKIISGDVNGDNLIDMVLLGASNDPTKLLIQQKSGFFKPSSQQGFINDQSLEGTCGAFLDFDEDGDQDLLIGHGGNEFKKGQDNFYMRLYENDGRGNFKINIESTPQVKGNLSCIEPCDFDKDGDLDLFIGARSVPGHYGLVPSSFLLQNNGDGSWTDLTTEEFGRLGMVTDATWTDLDGDDDQDLVVVGDWMPITIFENTPGALKKMGAIKDSRGWWSSMEAKDLDNDGDDDFILGNWGLNSKFKSSNERPITLYVKDFDRNGKVEQLIEWYPPADQKAYPFATREDIVAQIPHIGRKVEKYADFGKSTYTDLFDETQRQGALHLRATYLQSAILWNDSAGYRLDPLPVEAQVAPVFSIVAEDFDNDQIIDILLLGNFYGLKPEVGRLDANRGVVLKGHQEGWYEPVSSIESGLNIHGQVRDAKLIVDAKNQKRLIIARNNQSVVSYQLNEK